MHISLTRNLLFRSFEDVTNMALLFYCFKERFLFVDVVSVHVPNKAYKNIQAQNR